jgi:hypothetical protein
MDSAKRAEIIKSYKNKLLKEESPESTRSYLHWITSYGNRVGMEDDFRYLDLLIEAIDSLFDEEPSLDPSSEEPETPEARLRHIRGVAVYALRRKDKLKRRNVLYGVFCLYSLILTLIWLCIVNQVFPLTSWEIAGLAFLSIMLQLFGSALALEIKFGGFVAVGMFVTILRTGRYDVLMTILPLALVADFVSPHVWKFLGSIICLEE